MSANSSSSLFIDARRVALHLGINPSIYKETKSDNALYDAIIKEAQTKFKEYASKEGEFTIAQEVTRTLLFLVEGRRYTDKIKEDEQMKAIYLLILKGNVQTLDSLGNDLYDGLLYVDDEGDPQGMERTSELIDLINAKKLNNPEINKKLDELAEKIGNNNLAELGTAVDNFLAYYNERGVEIGSVTSETLVKMNLRCDLNVRNLEEVLCLDVVSNELYLVPANEPVLNIYNYVLPASAAGDTISSSIPNLEQALAMHRAKMLVYDTGKKTWIVPAIDGKNIIETDSSGNIVKGNDDKPIVIGKFLQIGFDKNDFIAANFGEDYKIDGEDNTFVHPEGYVIRDGKVESSQRFIQSIADANNGDKKKGIVDIDYSLPFGFPVYKTWDGKFIDGRTNQEMTQLNQFVKGDDKFIEKLTGQSEEEKAKLIQKREIWQSFIGSLSRPLSGIQKSFWDKMLLETGYTKFANQIIAEWMGWTPDKWAAWLCSKIVNEGLPDDIKVEADRTGNKVITMRLQGSKEQTVDGRTLYDINWLVAPAREDIQYDVCFGTCGNCKLVGDKQDIDVKVGDVSKGNFMDYVDEDYSSISICFIEKGMPQQSYSQPIVGDGFIPEDVAGIYANQLLNIENRSTIGNLTTTNGTNSTI